MTSHLKSKQLSFLFYIYSLHLQSNFVGVRCLKSSFSVSINSVIDKPYFDDVNPRNVSTVVDETAVLKCRVKNKGNRTVSWMRKRDLHILTTNIYTYTGDQRFAVIHTPGTDDWDLQIEYAQLKDSGIYECQVNTEPKINLPILFRVVTAARARILGSNEVFVKKDSTISVGCTVNINADSIHWYHNDRIVDFNSVRGGISLETEKTDTGTTSRLMLTRAGLKDSGNYSCVPTMAISASVQVHVLNGEHPAAMQTSGSAASGGVSCWNSGITMPALGDRFTNQISATTIALFAFGKFR